MGKRDKQKQKHDRSQRGRDYYLQDNEDYTTQPFSSSSSSTSTLLSPSQNDIEEEIEEPSDDADNNNEEEEKDENHQHRSHDMPSKFLLYQQSVQVSVPY